VCGRVRVNPYCAGAAQERGERRTDTEWERTGDVCGYIQQEKFQWKWNTL